MGSLIDIQSQIEKLQKQAADIRSREFNSTVQDILAKMAAFGITVKDLEAAPQKGAQDPWQGSRKSQGRRGPAGRQESRRYFDRGRQVPRPQRRDLERFVA